jgi:Rps23 Pro-64 3,4-dihydroxylase Tpa1-like proline 4-hydroxylase
VCEHLQEKLSLFKNDHQQSSISDYNKNDNDQNYLGYFYPAQDKAPMYLKSTIYQHRMHAIQNQSHHPPTMTALKSFFSSEKMLNFFSKLSRSHLIKHNLNPTWYKQGDHITIHNDKVKNRRLSYIIHLGRNATQGGRYWNKDYGGNLVWCDPPQVIVPHFNSMTIFAVSSRSYHFVEPVWIDDTTSAAADESSSNYHHTESTTIPQGKPKRFAISGFYFSDELEVDYWNSFAESLPYPLQPALVVN